MEASEGVRKANDIRALGVGVVDFAATKNQGLSSLAGTPKHVHFVGFRDDRYHAAVRVFGQPAFIHIGWDRRALREIGEGDTVVFADGPADQEPRHKSFPDILDGSEIGSWPLLGGRAA